MNIMLNQVCNLTCPYCFANEFVGRSEESLKMDRSQISEENFITAVRFAENSNEPRIGLIGGEPLLHPNFEKLVDIALNSNIPRIHLFTNGVYLDRYFNLFGSDRFSVLINVNSPEDIGNKQYQRMLDNIENLMNKMHARNKVSIGVNIYKEDMDFDFILDIIKKYNIKRLRLAITVPNTEDKRDEDVITYFNRMKKTTFKLFKELEKLKCMPSYDCNGMPFCITTEQEREWLGGFKQYQTQVGKTNILDNHKCSPVLDVLPNLDVVRCFGMSDTLKTQLTKFENTRQIRGYFEHEIDSLMSVLSSSNQCVKCLYKNTNTCMGGCLAFKLDKFKDLKNLVRNHINGEKDIREDL